MTDKVEANAFAETESGTVMFACTKGEPRYQIIVSPTAFLGGRLNRYDLRDTSYRFDDAQPVQDSWKYHDRSAVPYSSRAHDQFVKGLVTAQARLRLRLLDYANRPIDLEFTVAGARDAIKQAAAACGAVF